MRIFKFGTVLTFMFLFAFFGTSNPASAAQNTTESIEVHVSINEDGSAHITEHRIEDLHDGTEKYIVKEELGKSTIEHFKVTEDGQMYEFIDDWDINASREEKAFKNGIIETKNGYELAWGIGEYGRHEYTVEYTVTNFIKQLNDSQMLFWNFISESVPPGRIFVEIETVKPLTDEDESIWAFGYPGDIHFVDGKVIARSTESLRDGDQVIILVQFRDEIFTTEDKVNKNFEAIQEEAFIGSDYSLEESDSGLFSIIFTIVIVIFIFTFFGILIAVGVFIVYKLRGSTEGYGHRRKFTRRYQEEYYRDYPYEGDFMHAYQIVYVMGLSDFKTLFTALLLKWIKEDRIRIEQIESKGLFRKSNSKITFLNDDEMDTETLEGKLFSSIRQAAGNQDYIDDRALSLWAERNYGRLNNWESAVRKKSQEILENERHLRTEEKKLFFLTTKVHPLTESGEEIEKNIYKYVNYLNDFSLLHEHEAVNVKIWDDIMIWASYLNLTSVVTKQFEKLYPNYFETSVYDTGTIATTAAMASRADRSRDLAQSSSSGSGGSASSGGGGGSYGGGGSGGTR